MMINNFSFLNVFLFERDFLEADFVILSWLNRVEADRKIKMKIKHNECISSNVKLRLMFKQLPTPN